MSIRHRITGTVAALAALALGASATPASATLFDLNANGSFVPAQTTASNTTSVPPILPIVKASQLAKVEQAEQQAADYAPAKGARYSNAELGAYRTTATRHIISGVAGVATPQVGFDWGDAGIGATVGFVLALLGLGAAIVISQRRPRRSRRTTALTS
jgi:hypothetical protein